METTDNALLRIGQMLKARQYSFTTITPASHATIMKRRVAEDTPVAPTSAPLQDVFGRNLPFHVSAVEPTLLADLAAAEAIQEVVSKPGMMRSRVRFSTIGSQIFCHSAFPTIGTGAVFFGPDTYRFVRSIGQMSPWPDGGNWTLRVADIGSGSGAGGICSAKLIRGEKIELVLADINPAAVRISRVNAALNGQPALAVQSDLLDAIEGSFDLVISNPPYLVDPVGRTYRDGGGSLGIDLSVRIVKESVQRLSARGRLLLYTGTPVVDGIDMFLAQQHPLLRDIGLPFFYEEVDPDVFGDELGTPPYRHADRLAAVVLTVSMQGLQ